MGHVIDGNGLHASSDKVEAVLKAPRPKNVRELEAFLGSIHYYEKFMQNLSTLLQPLNELLKNDIRWNWTVECEKVFEEAKQKLMEAPVLAHYNPDHPLRLAADASAYGIGAVISHVLFDATEHPIVCASRTLTKSEQNYAQLEKEAFSLIFGINKFYSYLYGRKCILYTDHKPLTILLGPKQGIPPLAASRLQRWALILVGYDYEIEYKSITAHANTDMLSHLPIVPSKQTTVVNETTMLNIQQIETLPLTVIQLRNSTRYGRVLCKVLQYTKTTWPTESPSDNLRLYWNCRNELSVEDNCLLLGNRVVVPLKLSNKVLKELHCSHCGVVRMKSIAQSYVWWPSSDQEIERTVKS